MDSELLQTYRKNALVEICNTFNINTKKKLKGKLIQDLLADEKFQIFVRNFLYFLEKKIRYKIFKNSIEIQKKRVDTILQKLSTYLPFNVDVTNISRELFDEINCNRSLCNFYRRTLKNLPTKEDVLKEDRLIDTYQNSINTCKKEITNYRNLIKINLGALTIVEKYEKRPPGFKKRWTEMNHYDDVDEAIKIFENIEIGENYSYNEEVIISKSFFTGKEMIEKLNLLIEKEIEKIKKLSGEIEIRIGEMCETYDMYETSIDEELEILSKNEIKFLDPVFKKFNKEKEVICLASELVKEFNPYISIILSEVIFLETNNLIKKYWNQKIPEFYFEKKSGDTPIDETILFMLKDSVEEKASDELKTVAPRLFYSKIIEYRGVDEISLEDCNCDRIADFPRASIFS